jgi:uncharacterized membrane protein
MRSKPYNPDERFVRFSEFAAQNEIHSRLDLSGRHLNTIQFYNLDVFVFIFAVIILVLLIVFVLFKLVWQLMRKCCVRKAEVKSKNE